MKRRKPESGGVVGTAPDPRPGLPVAEVPLAAEVPRTALEITADRLAHETRGQLRAEVEEALDYLGRGWPLDLAGLEEVARDVRRLGPSYRAPARGLRAAITSQRYEDLASALQVVRAVLDQPALPRGTA
jgi:hypothetical protein